MPVDQSANDRLRPRPGRVQTSRSCGLAATGRRARRCCLVRTPSCPRPREAARVRTGAGGPRSHDAPGRSRSPGPRRRDVGWSRSRRPGARRESARLRRVQQAQDARVPSRRPARTCAWVATTCSSRLTGRPAARRPGRRLRGSPGSSGPRPRKELISTGRRLDGRGSASRGCRRRAARAAGEAGVRASRRGLDLAPREVSGGTRPTASGGSSGCSASSTARGASEDGRASRAGTTSSTRPGAAVRRAARG